MKRTLFYLAFLCLPLISLTLVSCDNDDDDNGGTEELLNIVEFAQSNPNYSLLVEAVIKAELVNDLSADGPITLFAPDNAAFEAFLDGGTIANTPKETLVTILTNHVIGGKQEASDLQTSYYETISATTFGENAFMYVSTDNGVTINGSSNVVQADIQVSNGVIHAIDAVIAPPTVVTFATSDPTFSSLVAALTAPGLNTNFVEVLSGEGPFTVFAPTNAAFQALLDSDPSWNSVTDIPTAVLEEVLLYHVTTIGNVRAEAITDGIEVNTLAPGESFTISTGAGDPTINAVGNTADIIVTNVQAQNGVVHVIDAVILPDLN
ncbi:MAG: fasciclin domain-containing protein [Bacteroidota bacterium]